MECSVGTPPGVWVPPPVHVVLTRGSWTPTVPAPGQGVMAEMAETAQIYILLTQGFILGGGGGGDSRFQKSLLNQKGGFKA